MAPKDIRHVPSTTLSNDHSTIVNRITKKPPQSSASTSLPIHFENGIRNTRSATSTTAKGTSFPSARNITTHMDTKKKKKKKPRSSILKKNALTKNTTEVATNRIDAENNRTDTHMDDSFLNSQVQNSGMMGGYGGYNSMMMPPMGMPPYGGGSGGPLSGLTNILFNFQQLVFTLGQAVQIVSMNANSLKQVFRTVVQMTENVQKTIRDVSAGIAKLEEKGGVLSKEEEKRRRRLKAFRWGMVLAVTFAGCKVIMSFWKKRRRVFSDVASVSVGGAYNARRGFEDGRHQEPYYNSGGLMDGGRYGSGNPHHGSPHGYGAGPPGGYGYGGWR